MTIFSWCRERKAGAATIDEGTNLRKTARYSSKDVLSGLLVCGECGHNYRRISRPSGEEVWRCASQVEHGKKFCKHSPSVSGAAIKETICERLGLIVFNEVDIKGKIDSTLVHLDGTLQIELQSMEYWAILLN